MFTKLLKRYFAVFENFSCVNVVENLVESFKMLEGFQFEIDEDNDMLVENVLENTNINNPTWTVS